MALLTTDALYLGFHGKFSSRYIEINTVNTVASVLTVKYWDGDSFEDVDDLLDQTSSGGKTFAQSGFVSWSNKEDWKLSNLTGTDADLQLYWVKLTVSVALAAATKLGSVINLYSDDDLLSIYFPELVSDVAYLPSGKTNFLEQHMAAKDLVVLRLKQRKIIDDESQILEPNDVAVAAVHAAAWVILKPIATSADSQALRDQAKEGFDSEISKVSFEVDINKTGTLSEAERKQNLSVGIYRR